jgi:hypothetical protein
MGRNAVTGSAIACWLLALVLFLGAHLSFVWEQWPAAHRVSIGSAFLLAALGASFCGCCLMQ